MNYENDYNGKLYDSPIQNKPNGIFCDECGAELIDGCTVCGAPICCPKCCKEATKEEQLNEGKG